MRHELNKTMLTLYKIGEFLWYGKNGMSKDKLKALDYWIRAAELGSAEACGAIVLLCERDTAVAPTFVWIRRGPLYLNKSVQ